MRTAAAFARMKTAGKRIAALTAYDASFARLLQEAGCDTILVGDSLGMVVQGRSQTQAVTLADIRYHVECVARGAPDQHLMADLPFGTYETGPRQAFAAAAGLIAAGAHMVKLEGGAGYAETIAYLVERGIPVCGHVGLLPQAALATGFALQGRDQADAERIMADARAVADAGAALIVLELIPAQLAADITAQVSAATIGIGAGRDCDGQILVLHDALGVYPKAPSFTKNFLAGADSVAAALGDYVAAVKNGEFPGDEQIPA